MYLVNMYNIEQKCLVPFFISNFKQIDYFHLPVTLVGIKYLCNESAKSIIEKFNHKESFNHPTLPHYKNNSAALFFISEEDDCFHEDLEIMLAQINFYRNLNIEKPEQVINFRKIEEENGNLVLSA